MIIKTLKLWFSKLVPRIHNLPQVIYIRWMDRDWYIKKVGAIVTDAICGTIIIVAFLIFASIVSLSSK